MTQTIELKVTVQLEDITLKPEQIADKIANSLYYWDITGDYKTVTVEILSR